MRIKYLMKLRYLLPLFFIFSLTVSIVMVWLAIRLTVALGVVAEMQDRRFESILLADELRQSSDDLTKFARMFVQSGDERFLQYFQKVLDIRNGKAPRPDGYEGIFWDLVLGGDDQLLETASGETTALEDRMRVLGFTEKEFALLAEAQKLSDTLTTIENLAFNAVRGRYYDESLGTYTIIGQKNMELAQTLLYDNNYLKAKASIMEPIGHFQDQVNARTGAALLAVRSDVKTLLLGTFVAAVSLLALLVAFSLLIYRRVINRAGALVEAAEKITAGDLDIRSGVRGKDELGILGTTFDHMVSRLAETLVLVKAAKARMEEELNFARDIQMSMLPHTFPAFPDRKELDIFAVLEPARETGGDLYDFFMIDEHRLCFSIGDVSDTLTTIENLAFNAVRGRYYDESLGTYTIIGQKNMELAQTLLYDNNYLKAKASIMEPIGHFQDQVNARTGAALLAVRSDVKTLLLGTFVAAVSLLALLVAFSLLIYRRVINRAGALVEAAEKITAGDLDIRSGVRGKDELGILGTTFDHMVSRLAETLVLVKAAKARMEEELNFARDIQMSMLPHTFPAFPDRKELDIFAVLEPARETGGDLYDFFMIDEHRLCFSIGDVSGKGVSAALFMAMTKIMLKSRATSDSSPASIVTHVNDSISTDNDACMFVTLYLGILNLRDGTLITTNAGHNPPLLRRRGGKYEWLDAKDGPFVGPISGIAFKESETQLHPGDELFFYTDGVTEADNIQRELFGNERLKAVLDQSKSTSFNRSWP